MYSAIRPALRASPRRPPARFIRGRRYPSSSRIRSFHCTRRLANAPNPPADPANAPVSNDGEDNKSREETAAEQPDAGLATEDPEMLAQKLQRSRELTRRYGAALRRSQRRNRAQDLPPVVVPDWFLKHDVLLSEQAHNALSPKRIGVTLSLSRSNSEEAATCSIPMASPADGVATLEQIMSGAWKSGLNSDQRRRFARQLAAQLGAGDKESVVQALERGEDPTTSDERRRALLSSLEALKRQLVETKDLLKNASDRRLLESHRKLLDRERDLERLSREYDIMTKRKSRKNIPPLVLAEVRATIAASLSTLQPATADPFPSAKTNLILHSPSNELDKVVGAAVISTAVEFGADVVVLQAPDLAHIAGDYLGEASELTPHSIRSLGYETYRLSTELGNEIDDLGNEDAFADDQETATGPSLGVGSVFPYRPLPFVTGRILGLATSIQALSQRLTAQQSPVSASTPATTVSWNEQPARTQAQNEAQLEDLKLANLLEALIDATELKRTRRLQRIETIAGPSTPPKDDQSTTEEPPHFFDYSMSPVGDKIVLHGALPLGALSNFNLAVNVRSSSTKSNIAPKAKIVYVRDFKELNATQYGGRIIQKLEDIIRKRRNAGESIMLVGTTCSLDLTPELSGNVVQSLQSDGEASFSRTIVVPAGPVETSSHATVSSSPTQSSALEDLSTAAEKSKFRSINLRHIQDMLRSLDPVASNIISNREKHPEELRAIASLLPQPYFWKVLTYDEVHRIALTALGLHYLDQSSGHLDWTHVALAMGLLKASDETKVAYVRQKAKQEKIKGMSELQKGMVHARSRRGLEASGTATSAQRQQDLERITMTATKHERRLMPGIANPDQIKTTFDQVHVPRETIDSIRSLTSMSLLRPDAFNYGVLATEKISGAMLYGPPGTGKTLLAKAVAKESGSTVLEVSGSQIMDKYVGEGEKNVTAIFSLARKLSPCIVFLDEADSIFASRDAMRERNSHRDILNQFLKEWDGLNDLSVFVLVATNRPFDVDDAVIRRLPRRLLVDLPTQADRKEIFRIHLRGEELDPSIDLDQLAKRTPYYSGSDIKNIAVSAALACVKEENEQAAITAAQAAAEALAEEGTPSLAPSLHPPQLVRGQKYDFPEKRILHQRHFDKALQEISASISEDMASLSAIKKFDEQYGDNKGKKKKRVFGIGVAGEKNEDVVRVRT